MSIFASCVYRCVNRGFVSTILRLLVYIAATVAAIKFNKQIADFLYQNVVHDAVRHSLVRNLNSLLSQTGESPKNILTALPLSLRVLIGHKGSQVAALPLDTADTLSSEIMDMALKAPLTTILEAASFLLLFTLAAWFMRWLAGFFTGVNNIPVIGAVNSVLGGIAGVLEGILSLFFTGFLLRLAIAMSGEVWWWLNSEVINSTYIWRHFY